MQRRGQRLPSAADRRPVALGPFKVGQSRQPGGLRQAADVVGVLHTQQRVGKTRAGKRIAQPQARQAKALRERARDADVVALPQQVDVVTLGELDIRLVDDQQVHPRRQPAQLVGRVVGAGGVVGAGDKRDLAAGGGELPHRQLEGVAQRHFADVAAADRGQHRVERIAGRRRDDAVARIARHADQQIEQIVRSVAADDLFRLEVVAAGGSLPQLAADRIGIEADRRVGSFAQGRERRRRSLWALIGIELDPAAVARLQARHVSVNRRHVASQPHE